MSPTNIIVRTPNWIGDHVMALPFYRGLREVYPKARVTLLMKESIRSLTVPGIVDEILTFPIDVKSIKEKNFDLAISLPATFSSAYYFWRCGIKERVGFGKDGNEIFYTASIKWKGKESGKHKSHLYLELLEYISAHPITFQSNKMEYSKKEKQIIIAPGASIPLRVWPYYEELLKTLLDKHPDFKMIFVGAKESSYWHEKLSKYSNERIIDCIDKTNLDELVELCKKSELVIANDSGVGHLAATLAGTKTVVIFGPGDPQYIMPLGSVYPIRNPDLPCSPCEKPYCNSAYGYQACLKSLSPQLVLKTVEEALHLK